LRKIVLIVLVSVALVAAGAFAFRSWWVAGTRRAEVDRILERADALASTEAGLSDAKLEFDRALSLDPDHVAALTKRGNVFLRLARYDDAIRDFRRAGELASGTELAQAQLGQGRALYERYRGTNADDDFRSARNRFQEALQDPSVEAEALEGVGTLYLVRGRNYDPDAALKSFQDLLKKHPDYVDADRVKSMVELLAKSSSGG